METTGPRAEGMLSAPKVVLGALFGFVTMNADAVCRVKRNGRSAPDGGTVGTPSHKFRRNVIVVLRHVNVYTYYYYYIG